MDCSSFQLDTSFRIKELFIAESGEVDARLISTASVLDTAFAIKQSLSRLCGCNKRMIGIELEKSPQFVAAAIGVLQSGNAFIALDPTAQHYSKRQCDRFKVAYVIKERKKGDDGEILTSNLRISPFASQEILPTTATNIIYAIQTSGSTGEPKTVHVPWQSIMSNVIDFKERFSLNKQDSILFCTPLSFDPSMVELLLALQTGAELIIVPPAFNSRSRLLEEAIIMTKPTFVQLTPALLLTLSQPFLRQHLFSTTSPITNLLIGGDAFPLNLIRAHWNNQCPMNIFNVYGVTEVSCWASIYQLKKIIGGESIPIGDPLLNTSFEIDKQGQLVIIGRKCIVDREWMINATTTTTATQNKTKTGDTAFIQDKQLYVSGRRKPNSTLQEAAEVESILMAEFKEIVFAKLIYADECRFLFVRHADGHSHINDNELLSKMAHHHRPTRTWWNVPLDKLITANGKICELALLQFVELELNRMVNNTGEGARAFLSKAYGLGAIKAEEEESLTLNQLGLGSLEIAELTFFIRRRSRFVIANNGYLTGNTTLKDLIGLMDEALTGNIEEEEEQEEGSENRTALSIELIQPSTSIQQQQKWSLDMEKCIDASPVISDGLIYIGSHNGMFWCVDSSIGAVIWQHRSENARFECTCAVSDQMVAVGYFLHKRDVSSKERGGLLLFKKHQHNNALHMHVKTEGDVRMKPLIDPLSQKVYFGAYDGKVRAIDPFIDGNSNSQIWEAAVLESGEAVGMRSTPLILGGGGSIVVVGALDGTVVAFEAMTGGLIWRININGPIFADLLIPINDGDFCMVATATGLVISIDINGGQKVSEIHLPQAIFDAPCIIRSTLIFSGSEGSLYVVSCESGTAQLHLKRCISVGKGIRLAKSPLAIGPSAFIQTTTDGRLLRFSIDDLLSYYPKAIEVCDIKAQTFGQPIVIPLIGSPAYRIIVGARDNWLRCVVLK